MYLCEGVRGFAPGMRARVCIKMGGGGGLVPWGGVRGEGEGACVFEKGGRGGGVPEKHFADATLGPYRPPCEAVSSYL